MRLGLLSLSFWEKKGWGRGPEITDVTGASAANMIPGSSTAVIRSKNPGKLEKKMAARSSAFVESKGKGLTFSFKKKKGRLHVTAKGVSAHSSEPEHGVNPAQGIFCFLHESAREFKFRKNRFTSAAAYVSDMMGTGFSGEQLGIAFSSEKTGPFTSALTQVRRRRGRLDLVINLRVPYGMDRGGLRRQIEKAHAGYSKRRGRRVNYTLFIGRPFRSGMPDDLIRLLSDTFNSVTGLQAAPTGAGGGTAARYLPRAVSFGPCYPGEKCMMHVENEYRERERFLTDIQLITEVIIRAGNY
jgi:acetylornithine deacetylase/succinyl-diaminopimelate desuccinylase-like protein